MRGSPDLLALSQSLWLEYKPKKVSTFALEAMGQGEFRFLWLNPYYEENVGLKTAEIAGKTPHECLPQATADSICQRYEHCRSTGATYSYGEYIELHGQNDYWETTLHPHFLEPDDDYPSVILGQAVNVTTDVKAERALRKAMRQGMLTVHYQPVIRLADMSLRGFEALTRWPGRTGSPEDWLRVAKKAGLMPQINRLVLGEVARSLSEIKAGKYPGIPPTTWISVNIDVFGIATDLKSEIARWGVCPGLLSIEISEGAEIGPAQVKEIADIHGAGHQFKLDDFWKDRSGMERLTMLKGIIRTVKIDRQYITGIDKSPDNQAVVKAIMDLARHFNLLVIAEGVETDAELKECERLGVQEVQGWHPLLGKAGPLAEYCREG